jgi:hypothetical protein
LLKEVLFSSEDFSLKNGKDIIGLITVPLILVFSITLFSSLKKMGLNLENAEYIKNKKLVNASIIGLALFCLNFTVVQVIKTIRFARDGFSISPLLFVIIGALIYYIFLLYKLFTGIKKAFSENR